MANYGEMQNELQLLTMAKLLQTDVGTLLNSCQRDEVESGWSWSFLLTDIVVSHRRPAAAGHGDRSSRLCGHQRQWKQLVPARERQELYEHWKRQYRAPDPFGSESRPTHIDATVAKSVGREHGLFDHHSDLFGTWLYRSLITSGRLST